MITRTIVLLLLLTSFSLTEAKAVIASPPANTGLTKANFIDLSNEDLATQLGRPLDGKEKALFWIAKRKVRRELRRHPEQASQPLMLPQANTDEPKTNQAGLFSFITASVALLAAIAAVPILFLLGTVASIILGISSLGQFKRTPERYKGRGWAIAGLVLSGLFVLLMILFIIVLAAWLAAWG